MSKIDDLIQQYCPNGVEYKTLGEICNFKRGTSITKAQTKIGNIPVIAGGQIPAYYHDQANRTGETITVSGSGAYAGFIAFWTIPIFVSDAFTVEPKSDLLPKYVFYFLTSIQDRIYETKKGGGVPHVHGSSIAHFSIPIPPLEVQREIVQILDNFTELTAELTAELEARKKQYEYYRDQLLTFGNDVEWKTLGDIAEITRGGNFQKKDFVSAGRPCIHYGQMYTYYGIHANKTITFVSDEIFKKSKTAKPNNVVMAVTSENVEDVCSCVAWIGKEDIAVSGHTAIISHNQNAKYLAYYFQTRMFFAQKVKLAHGTKVIEVTPSALGNVKIPVPPLAEQERIVAILDKFDALTNSITEGLPREIELRQKQYEHYRNKLLTFEEIS